MQVSNDDWRRVEGGVISQFGKNLNPKLRVQHLNHDP
jgi:hypothetical protein